MSSMCHTQAAQQCPCCLWCIGNCRQLQTTGRYILLTADRENSSLTDPAAYLVLHSRRVVLYQRSYHTTYTKMDINIRNSLRNNIKVNRSIPDWHYTSVCHLSQKQQQHKEVVAYDWVEHRRLRSKQSATTTAATPA